MMHLRFTSVVSMMILAATAACSDSESATATDRPTSAEDSAETIDIALVGSFTGAIDPAVAEDVQRGVLTAVTQVNALGGILGKRLAVKITDDASSPTNAAARIKDLADSGVVFGIGPSTSSAAKEMLPLVKSDKVLYISPSATAMDLDCVQKGATAEETAQLCETAKAAVDPFSGKLTPVLFRTAASDAFLATAIAQYASQAVGGLRRCRSIAIVRQSDAYSAELAERVRTRYVQLNLAVRRVVDINEADTEIALRAAAEAVALSPVPECQVVIAGPQVAASYVKVFNTWRAGNATGLSDGFQTIGSDGFHDAQFTAAAEAQAEGSLAVASDTAPNTQEFNIFRSLFQVSFPGVEPGRHAAPAYDAVMLLAGAMAKSGTATSIPAVRKALVDISTGRRRASSTDVNDFLAQAAAGEDIDYEGASGPLDFDARTGGVRNTFSVWRIKQQLFVREASFDPSVITGD
jgi:ABC-type branched-subunit amino acid transport system substrate-binding protein